MPARPTGSRPAGPTASPNSRRRSATPSPTPRVANPGCYPTGADRAPAAAGGCRADPGRLPDQRSMRSAAIAAAARSMIEAYEAAAAPSFELYGARLRAQARARDAEIFRPDPAADLRALGRQFPAGHAGQHSAPPRYAARPPGRATLEAALTGLLRRGAASSGRAGRRRRQRSSAWSPRRSTTPTAWSCCVFGTRLQHALLVARLDNLGKGASGAAVQNIRLMLGLI